MNKTSKLNKATAEYKKAHEEIFVKRNDAGVWLQSSNEYEIKKEKYKKLILKGMIFVMVVMVVI